jgi:large subunit ribosomal protein L24
MNTKTKDPSKQRKRIYNASLHSKRKLLIAPVSKKLVESVGKKRLTIRKGDTVKVLVGNYKGKSGKVEKVDYDKTKVFIKDIFNKNSRGQEKLIPFVASNLIIIDLYLEDSRRIKKKITKSTNVVK